MATILEALQNAQVNLVENHGKGMVPYVLGKEQLTNAVTLLEKGYGLYDDVEPLLEAHGDVASVPDKQD